MMRCASTLTGPFRIWLLFAGWLVFRGAAGAGELSLGPLVSDFPLTMEEGERREAAGPLFSWERTSEEASWGIHPLFSWTTHAADASEFDGLYPLLTYDRFGPESRWQLFQMLSVAGSSTASGEGVRRYTLFPFVFLQRSPGGSNDYSAVWPFYGTLRNRLFRDEIHFAGWPLYVWSRKGGGDGRMGVTTRNYLFPLVHVREGEGVRGWQVWPVAGYEEKKGASRTNTWGDVEWSAGYRKRMVLWPLVLNEDRQLGSENPEHHLAVLPLFSRMRSPLRDSLTAPWPIGLTLTEDRAKGYREWGLPWPLVVFARGAGKTADRVWPFFSRVRAGGLSSGFLLWPIFKVNRQDSPPLWRERIRVLLFLYSDVTQRSTETGETSRRTDLWPLFTARREADGSTRLQLLAPLEPLLPGSRGVARNWSPVWSLWRSEAHPKSGRSSVSVLWNLYRQDVGRDARKFSLLFGLFQYQSSPVGRGGRLLGVPFGTRPSRLVPPES